MKNHLPNRLSVLEGWVRLSILGITAWLREREMRLQAEETVRRLQRTVDTLYQAKDQKEKDVEALRKENLFLLRKAYRILGELADNYHSYHSPSALYKLAEERIGEINGGPDGRKQLILFLDTHLDRHPISDLRKAFHRLTEEYIVLFCYLVLAYPPKWIIELMDPDNPQTVYTMKHRLLRRILRLGPARSRRFLDLLP
jgi:hypothetical protein